MNEWERKRKMRIYKAKLFSPKRSKQYFLIGIVAAIMNYFLMVPVLGLISLVFFLFGVIGSLI